MNYIRLAPTRSASLIGASGGPLSVRLVIGQRLNQACPDSRLILEVYLKGRKTGLVVILHPSSEASQPHHPRFQGSTHALEFHSIPITEIHVTV
jgi:hypothetical protein